MSGMNGPRAFMPSWIFLRRRIRRVRACPGLDETELPCMRERIGAGRDAELPVDRPRVTVNRVVREIELAADVAFREASPQHSKDHQLAVAQRRLAPAKARAVRSLERFEARRQEPGIRARLDRRSRLGERLRRRVVPPHRPQYLGLPKQRIRERTRMLA